jgi:hypothetical protein
VTAAHAFASASWESHQSVLKFLVAYLVIDAKFLERKVGDETDRMGFETSEQDARLATYTSDNTPPFPWMSVL